MERMFCSSCRVFRSKGGIVASLRLVSTSATTCQGYGGLWRLQRGEAVNKTRYGPLTDLPDFTFVDGRPTPMTPAQLRRKNDRKEVANTVMKLLKEVDEVKENNSQTTTENETKRRKLKAKG